jgi:hypothetical protein
MLTQHVALQHPRRRQDGGKVFSRATNILSGQE